VQVNQERVGEIETGGYSPANEKESNFWSCDVRLKLQSPTVHNDRECADNVSWNDDLESYDLNWEIGKVLLLSLFNYKTEAAGVASGQMHVVSSFLRR
jgi:hypothetical protein